MLCVVNGRRRFILFMVVGVGTVIYLGSSLGIMSEIMDTNEYAPLRSLSETSESSVVPLGELSDMVDDNNDRNPHHKEGSTGETLTISQASAPIPVPTPFPIVPTSAFTEDIATTDIIEAANGASISPPTPTSTLFSPAGPLPAIHWLNEPPDNPPSTPLFIGFTRNFPILQQSLISYIAAGFPPSQIYIVDNTGTMDSNPRGLLTPQNPFYLPHSLLRDIYGINVITTPAILTFSQLQNFYISQAIERGWKRFLWSHMDAVVVSFEDRRPYKSLYQRILEVLEKLDIAGDRAWGLKFFSYDRLTLVNVHAVKEIGGWDTLIPYYYSDCDFYDRMRMYGWPIDDEEVGHIFDVGGVIPDLGMFFPGWEPNAADDHLELLLSGEDKKSDLDNTIPPLLPHHFRLLAHLTNLQTAKNTREAGRNFWQVEQKGGQGEPFYRPAVKFDEEIGRLIAHGQDVYGRKWGFEKGQVKCDLRGAGKTLEDAWSDRLIVEGS